MKTINYLFALTLLFTSFGSFAKELAVNTEKSTIGWVGKKIGGQHEGNIKVKSGSLELKKNKIVAGGFTIDMTSITCSDLADAGYNKKLVGHLNSDDFFGVQKFSVATFKIKSATKFNNNKASVTGDLTIKGKTESITFDVVKDNKNYTAKINVDRTKFGIKYGSTSFFDNLKDKAIDNIFTLDISLTVN